MRINLERFRLTPRSVISNGHIENSLGRLICRTRETKTPGNIYVGRWVMIELIFQQKKCGRNLYIFDFVSEGKVVD